MGNLITLIKTIITRLLTMWASLPPETRNHLKAAVATTLVPSQQGTAKAEVASDQPAVEPDADKINEDIDDDDDEEDERG